jgi:hypothetical protein
MLRFKIFQGNLRIFQLKIIMIKEVVKIIGKLNNNNILINDIEIN